MTFDLAHSVTVALPELLLAIGAMALLVFGVFRGDASFRLVTWLSVIVYAGALWLVVDPNGINGIGFKGLFVQDAFARFLKALILIGGAAAAIIAMPFLERMKIARFEYPILLMLASLGMLMMVSANDLLSLYLGLELQSLALYVLAAFHRDNARSTEAGLKYFVLGALSSGILLYGASLVYGFTGTTNFDALQAVLAASLETGEPMSIGLVFGLVFILAGLAFKVSAVPFHMWTPDVYEGSPTPVTAFFSAAPKVAAMGLLIRVVIGGFPALLDQWSQIIIFISIASMALTNIKRLLAYSSIGHVGYALLGVAASTQAGVQAVLVYMAIYLVTTIGAFLCVMAMRRADGQVEDIADLAGLSQRQPRLAFCMAVLMFSLAGVPLLLGFIGKLVVFNAAIDAGLVIPALLGVLASVVAAYYYLRIVKIMYFDEPVAAFETGGELPSRAILGISTAIASPIGYLLIGPLTAAAAAAAASLIG